MGVPETDWASNQSSAADSKDCVDTPDDVRAGTLGDAAEVSRKFERIF